MSNIAAHTVSSSQTANLTNPITTTTTTVAAAATTAITTTRNNVSVTNINCEVNELAASSTGTSTGAGAGTTTNGNIVPIGGGVGVGVGVGVGGGFYNGSIGSAGAIRIPVSKAADDSDSEAELTNIENLKVTRRVSTTNVGANDAAGGNGNGNGNGNGYNKNGPRPMSWEGELSETETTETELMETENSLSNSGMASMMSSIPSSAQPSSIGVAVIRSEATTTTPALARPSSAASSLLKPEMEALSMDMLHSSASIYSPLTKLKLAPTQSDPINLKYEPTDPTSNNISNVASAASPSPLLTRNRSTTLPLPANPSPDSAIHSVYTHSSPSQSPLTSRHAPYTPSLSRNNSDASHSSCYSYSSEFSPTHSPIQGRHAQPAASSVIYGNFNGSLHHTILYRPVSADTFVAISPKVETAQNLSTDTQQQTTTGTASGLVDGLPSSPAGISRQQLINSPCPICGDKISGFHYGIFSCESCKGFFKRTVQNRKNYVCVRGGPCPVSISTRKKCPACRFEKCLQKGMKLEAIREDRTRGGRSTYQCSYTLPNSMLSPLLSPDQQSASALAAAAAAAAAGQQHQHQQHHHHHHHQQQHHQQRLGQTGLSPHGSFNGYNNSHGIKTEQTDPQNLSFSTALKNERTNSVPTLLQEIMDVEHLWLYNEAELARLNQPLSASASGTGGSGEHTATSQQMTNPILASAGISSNGENASPDLIAHLCNVADHRLFKIVKWCKSLPLFKNISIDDQICLLINSWCELLLFSCCFRSVDTPGEIKLSQGKKVTLTQARTSGLQACIERMLNLADHLRRLRVDRYEYVAMKVIVLLQSDTSELEEPVKVRECQEKALQSLQSYTIAHYPDMPSKFGELLLRIPELQRTCQLGKEMLTLKSRDGNGEFNLLMELLRGEH